MCIGAGASTSTSSSSNNFSSNQNFNPGFGKSKFKNSKNDKDNSNTPKMRKCGVCGQQCIFNTLAAGILNLKMVISLKMLQYFHFVFSL